MYEHNKIFAKVRQNLYDFHQPIEMPGGYSFDHVRTLRRINLYYNGKFESGEYDGQGYRKFFYNITKPSCDIATKFVDLDTKDIILYSKATGDEFRMWMMQKDLRTWLRLNDVPTLLNDTAQLYPKGVVVWKRASDGKWHILNVENLRMETANGGTLEDSHFVYEVNSLSYRQMLDMGWKKEKIELLRVRHPDKFAFDVLEVYHQQDAGKKWKRYFVADYLTKKVGAHLVESSESQINTQEEYSYGVVLFDDEVDELPYRELAWEKVPGRWLPFGFIEYLFDNQVRINEVVNLKSKGLVFSSLHLFQTRDENVGRNVLTNMQNGDVLKVTQEVTPVATETRNLSEFANEEARWDLNTERKTFSFDISRGENPPSGTPLGLARLSAGMVATYFALKKQNFGIFLRSIIMDDIFKTFKKQSRKEHIVKFSSSDSEIDKLRQVVVESHVQKAMMKYIMETGTMPDKAIIDMEKMKAMMDIRKQKELGFTLGEDYYEGAEANVDVVTTGEQIDLGTRSQTLQTVLQIIGSNPNVVIDPRIRSVFFKMLEAANISPVELNLMEENLNNPMLGMMAPAPQTAQLPAVATQPAGMTSPAQGMA